jgi:hypothetical protein
VAAGAGAAAGSVALAGAALGEVAVAVVPDWQSQPSPLSLAVQATCLVFFAITGSDVVKVITRAAAGAEKCSVRASSLAKSDIIYVRACARVKRGF